MKKERSLFKNRDLSLVLYCFRSGESKSILPLLPQSRQAQHAKALTLRSPLLEKFLCLSNEGSLLLSTHQLVLYFPILDKQDSWDITDPKLSR